MVENRERHAAKYVIQRASESRCEWWTGTGWSEDETGALRFADEPHAAEETGDESATAQVIEA
jgi:hypothetical protein